MRTKHWLFPQPLGTLALDQNPTLPLRVLLQMHYFKMLFSYGAVLVAKTCLLPWRLVRLLRLTRQQMVLNALEAERLDRIRHPSKYLGK